MCEAYWADTPTSPATLRGVLFLVVGEIACLQQLIAITSHKPTSGESNVWAVLTTRGNQVSSR